MRNHPPEHDAKRAVEPDTGAPKRRLWLTLTVGVIGFLAAGWTVAWQITAMMTEAALDRWMDDRRAVGDRLAHTGKPMLEGFPFEVRLRIEDPVWELPHGTARLTLAGPTVTIANTPLAPTRLRIETPEALTAAFQAPDGSGPERVVKITGERALTDLDIGPRTITAGTVLLTGVTATDQTGAGEILGTIDRLELSMRPPVETTPVETTPAEAGISQGARAADSVPISMMLEIGVDRLILSDRFEVPFEGPADLDARVAVEGTLGTSLGASLNPAALALWRDQGGMFDIRAMSLRWEPMALVGHGTFGLDPMLRPEGAATVSASGLPGVIDRVVEMGRMTRGPASWLKLALIAGAKTPEEGGPPRVTLPLTIQGGVVSLGPAPIGRVGPVIGPVIDPVIR